MGSISRKGISVTGEQSFVLTRAPGEEEEGWSVERRPYPKADLLQDANTLTCLLGGNRVRMADGSSKPIEAIKVGEQVMTMSGARAVEKTESTALGPTRHVLELRGIGDEVLLLSNEHPLWVSRTDKSGVRSEWWGTYNIHHVLFEMENMTGIDFKQLPFILRFDLPEQVAHESGWLHVRPIFHQMKPDTKLYHLVVEDGFSFIAEGFPVFSHCRDYQGPAAAWTGLDRGAAVAKTVERLISAE